MSYFAFKSKKIYRFSKNLHSRATSRPQLLEALLPTIKGLPPSPYLGTPFTVRKILHFVHWVCPHPHFGILQFLPLVCPPITL